MVDRERRRRATISTHRPAIRRVQLNILFWTVSGGYVLTFTTSVSRKTPLDGRLEIPASLADRLLSSGEPLALSFQGTEVAANVEAMACTCAKAGGNHKHHFLAADVLRELAPDSSVTLLVDPESGRIEIDSTP